MTIEEVVKTWDKYLVEMKQNKFLAAQEDKIFDPANPRIVKVNGFEDSCYVLASSNEKLNAKIFSFDGNQWISREEFDAEWEFGAYNIGEYPDGGYKEQHEVYTLAKAKGFKIDPLDITIETIVADIRGEINED